MHQSGHNSGVIHSGIYYRPGSKKAQYCREGRHRLVEFCKQHKIPHDICGKVIVAKEKSEVSQLKRLYERGIENRIEDLQVIDDKQLREAEPHCRGIAAIRVGAAGIVDFRKVCKKLAGLFKKGGGILKLNEEAMAIHNEEDHFRLSTTTHTFTSRAIINCAGLQADRIARMAGFKPGVQIIPFRGEYFKLNDDASQRVKSLIYPLPDENFPFLGVHCTRMINGDVECGPNAVLSLSREGYSRWSVRIGDTWEIFRYRGFRKLARKHWKMGWTEVRRSFLKSKFTEAVQELLPEIQKSELQRATPGIRAIAVDPEGNMIDDFKFISDKRQLHVLNAPSPAATASLKLGEEIADKALREFRLEDDTSS